MTAAFIHDLIPRRMDEMGIPPDGYRVEMHSIRVESGELVRMRAFNRWVYLPIDLINNPQNIQVESNFGCMDLSSPHRVQEFEHTGIIEFYNPGAGPMVFPIITAMAEPYLRKEASNG